MFSKMVAGLKSIGTGIYLAAAIVFATVVACVRFYFTGRANERADAEAAAAKDEARKVKEAGERGDAPAVLDSFRRATNKRRK